MVFECFLLSINKQLQGIKICGQPTIKALAFADDCVLAIHDSLDTKKFIKIYEVFSGISQAKINTGKTEVIEFGNSRLSIPWNTKPSKNPICHLGILISIYGFACDDMENNLLQKIQLKINSWKPRFISIIGRILLINTFITSKINYFAQGIPLSSGFIKKFNNVIQRFIWNTHSPPVSIDHCFLPRSKGGMNLINLSSHAAKLYLKTIIQLVVPCINESNWSKATNIFFARSLELESPTNKLTFSNFLIKHPLTPGPHDCPDYCKRLFNILRLDNITVCSMRETGQRGTQPNKILFFSILLKFGLRNLMFRILTLKSLEFF